MTGHPDCRTVLAGLAAFGDGFAAQNRWSWAETEGVAHLILFNGRIATLDRQNPEATAIAIRDGRFIVVGTETEVMQRVGASTQRVDLKRRRVIPGLIDSHMHIIRGGLNYNMELRWDGVRSLGDALRMLKQQADRTPPPQWVRVVGGFSGV